MEAQSTTPDAPASGPAAPGATANSLAAMLEQAVKAAGPQVVTANTGAVPIDDESISGNEFDVYKVRKDITDRISVLLPKSIYFGRVHYVEDKGYYICGSNWKKQAGQEILLPPAALCCQRLDAPKPRFSALVIQYQTTPKGQIVSPFGFEMKVWRFNARTFEQLRTANSEFPLDQHDLLVTAVDDPKYQKCNISSCRESFASNAAFVAKYGADVQAWVTAMLQKIERTIGSKPDASGWSELLTGVSQAAAQTAVAADAPIQDITELLNI